MTSRERFLRMYQHREADRVPIIDSPWNGTLSRWHAEDLPKNVDWTEYFDVDRTACIDVDIGRAMNAKCLRTPPTIRSARRPGA